MKKKQMLLVTLLGLSGMSTIHASEIKSEEASSVISSENQSEEIIISSATSKLDISEEDSSISSIELYADDLIDSETDSDGGGEIIDPSAPVETYYPNGNLKSRVFYIDGVVDEKYFYSEEGYQTVYEDWDAGHKLSRLTYDSNGDYLTQTYYQNDIKTRYEQWSNGYIVTSYEYDSLGKVEVKTQYVDGIKSIVDKWTNGIKTSSEKFDSSGNLLSSTLYANGIKSTYREYVSGVVRYLVNYDTNGKVTRKTNYYSNGKRSKLETWSNGKVTKSTKYLTDGTVDNITSYANGRKSRYEKWNSGKRVYLFTYLSNGRVSNKTFYTASGHKSKYEHWANGRRTSLFTYYGNGQVKTKTFYHSNGKRSGYYVYRTSYNKRSYRTPNHKKSNAYCPYYNNGYTKSYTKYYTNGKPMAKCEYSGTNERVQKTRYDVKGNRILKDYFDYSKPDFKTRNYRTVVYKKTIRDKGYRRYRPSSMCSMKRNRRKNVVVDIGVDSAFANRDYLGYTNKYGQLIKVEAGVIVRQSDYYEKTVSAPNGIESDTQRYCRDEAKVKGTEKSKYVSGHAIADSLGGAANAYNITPESSYQNVKGTQAHFEKKIRDAIYKNRSVVTDFEMRMKYKNHKTNTPSSYAVKFRIDGKLYKYNFKNK